MLGAGPGALAQSAAPPSEMARVLARYGVRPVDPPVPARAFELPKLDGGRVALSDLAGRWVVLTFWATWCGPCRSEMPSLERLHQRRESSGVSVVGISVDRTAAMAQRFVDDYGLTFANLWDHRGAAASAYRAQSIPLTYLIDPMGAVVAVSVGARDWLALEPMVDELVALAPPGERPPVDYEIASDAPLELPRTFTPPSAEARLVTGAPRASTVEVGEPFTVEVRVNWAGHFEDYLLHPPRISLPEGIEQADLRASTRSSDGRNVVVYRVDLKAREPGSYALDPVELIYTPRAEAEPISSRVAGPEVSVSEATVLGARPAVWLGGAAGVLAMGVLAVLLLGRGRRGAVGASDDAGAEALRMRERLDGARRRRLEGDARGAALELALLERDLGVDGDEERAALERWIEGARYGGHRPTAEELETLERRVARRVGQMQKDPRQAARESLRLRNQES